MKFRTELGLVAIVLSAICLRADDGAASIAAGGIIVMKREPRIVMAKEVLQISTKKVIVDYDFRNDSDEDITTEVAFPIPDYTIDEQQHLSKQGFDDFRLWIEEVPAAFQTETRALLKDKDYTDLLGKMHIDIPSFAHMAGLDAYPDVARISPAQHKELEVLGLIYRDSDLPMWQIRKKYYWLQTFPARKTVHIRHEYTPNRGWSNSFRGDKFFADEFKSFCLDQQLWTKLESTANEDRGYSYIDFVLTTANTWKTPIEDFSLIVERPRSKNNRGDTETNYVSFCWNGPVTKIDADHFSAHTVNLVPSKELRIGFFSVQPRKF